MTHASLSVSVGGVHCAADQDLVKRFLGRVTVGKIDFRMRNCQLDRNLVVVSGDKTQLFATENQIRDALGSFCPKATIVHADDVPNFAEMATVAHRVAAVVPLG